VDGDCRSDIVFVLDSTGFTLELNLFIVKQFVMDIIHRVKISADQTHVGVVTYTAAKFHLQQYYDVDIMAKTIWELFYLYPFPTPGLGMSVSGTVVSASCCITIISHDDMHIWYVALASVMKHIQAVVNIS